MRVHAMLGWCAVKVGDEPQQGLGPVGQRCSTIALDIASMLLYCQLACAVARAISSACRALRSSHACQLRGDAYCCCLQRVGSGRAFCPPMTRSYGWPGARGQGPCDCAGTFAAGIRTIGSIKDVGQPRSMTS